MKTIIIIGGGGHAKVLADITHSLKQFEILGYVDPIDRGSLLGFPYLGNDLELASMIQKYPACAAALGIGITGPNTQRSDLYQWLMKQGYNLPAIISPHAVVSPHAVIDRGTVVFHGAVIQAGVELGKACIVNTNATVEHDCIIGDFVHIAPGSVICGGVTIGSGCMIGAGSTILPGRKITSGCILGAGSVVIKDCDKPACYVGIPAREIS
jgi:sugar O-acyltransferase (sialic acid O-acetyltransferase NeuD family)